MKLICFDSVQVISQRTQKLRQLSRLLHIWRSKISPSFLTLGIEVYNIVRVKT